MPKHYNACTKLRESSFQENTWLKCEWQGRERNDHSQHAIEVGNPLKDWNQWKTKKIREVIIHSWKVWIDQVLGEHENKGSFCIIPMH